MNTSKNMNTNANSKEKEDYTMTTTTKPEQQAFILNPQKAKEFLGQNNDSFKALMNKFEKFNKKRHSISEKD